MVEVFHGTDDRTALEFRTGHDLFAAATDPYIPLAVFSSDIRYSVVFAGGIGRGAEMVTTWKVPQDMLLLVDEDNSGVRWYRPSKVLEDLSSLTPAYLRHTRYKNLELARLAVNHGEVRFFHVSNQYYQGAETVRSILGRLSHH